jgi:hypothetical protein
MRQPQQAFGRALGAVAAGLLTFGSAPGCLARPSAEALVATGFQSPRQTLQSFQTFVRADLPAREYRCFSMGFRERNGLSALSYGEIREDLFRRQPWLRWIARAEVVGEQSVGEAEHWMDLRTLGRTVRVKLVREDFFEIHAGEDFLTDGDCDFGSLVRFADEEGGGRLSVRLSARVDEGSPAPTEVLIARHWKIDDVRELTDDELPSASATP